jgi:hypothetical protein
MRGLLTILKKLFFWNYERNTWQWDVLCVVILIFIFLSPKEWFQGSERARSTMHQTLVFAPEVIVNEADKAQIQERVKGLMGRNDVEVLDVRKVVGSDGRTLRIEVDIR